MRASFGNSSLPHSPLPLQREKSFAINFNFYYLNFTFEERFYWLLLFARSAASFTTFAERNHLNVFFFLYGRKIYCRTFFFLEISHWLKISKLLYYNKITGEGAGDFFRSVFVQSICITSSAHTFLLYIWLKKKKKKKWVV